MMADINLALSAVILVVITLNLIGVYRAERNTRKTTAAILGYRATIDWMTARVDTLEAKVNALETRAKKQSNG